MPPQEQVNKMQEDMDQTFEEAKKAAPYANDNETTPSLDPQVITNAAALVTRLETEKAQRERQEKIEGNIQAGMPGLDANLEQYRETVVNPTIAAGSIPPIEPPAAPEPQPATPQPIRQGAPEVRPVTSKDKFDPFYPGDKEESLLDKGGRMVKESAAYVKQEAAERLPYSVFGRLGAKFERLGIKIASAPKKDMLERMSQWRGERAIKAEAGWTGAKKAIEVIEGKLAQLEAGRQASEDKIKSGGAHLYDAKVAAKQQIEYTRSRNRLMIELEKAKTKENKAHAKFEYRTHKKEGADNKQNNFANKIVRGVDARLESDKVKFAELMATQDTINKEFERIQSAVEFGKKGIETLRTKLQAIEDIPGKEAFVDSIQDRIQEIEKIIGDLHAYREKKEKELAGIASKMSSLNLYLGQWNVFRNEELRVTTQERNYADHVPQHVEEAGENREHTYSHAPETPPEVPAAPQAAPANPEPQATPETEANLETIGDKETDARTYLKKWNELFEGDSKITARDLLPARIFGKSTMPVKDMEKVVQKFLETKYAGSPQKISGLKDQFNQIRKII